MFNLTCVCRPDKWDMPSHRWREPISVETQPRSLTVVVDRLWRVRSDAWQLGICPSARVPGPRSRPTLKRNRVEKLIVELSRIFHQNHNNSESRWYLYPCYMLCKVFIWIYKLTIFSSCRRTPHSLSLSLRAVSSASRLRPSWIMSARASRSWSAFPYS